MLVQTLEGRFIGQSKIVSELSFIAESILSGENHNILLEAPSGYGKSTLAIAILRYVTPNFTSSYKYRINSSGINFQEGARFHFIDEVHLLKRPEDIYEPMSSRNYSFILATNNYDLLEEPLRNRCIRFLFTEYSKEELAHIIYKVFKRRNMSDVPSSWCLALSDYSRGTPRIAEELATRVSIIVEYSDNYSFSSSTVHEIMFDILGTERGGITERDRQYITTLKHLGGTASLERLCSTAKIPKTVIEHEIEPFLIRKGKLLITSKGRSLADE